MGRFTVLVIAVVLAPGLISALPRSEIEISNYPFFFGDGVEAIPRPLPVLPEVQPEFEAEPVPESDVVPPKLISLNPCEACFEYMTALIDQLTEVAVPEVEVPVHPELPDVDVEPQVPEIGRPIPIPVNPENDLRPLPIPVAPEVPVNPIPIPVAPETEIRPLPVPVAPEVGIRPIPIPFGV